MSEIVRVRGTDLEVRRAGSGPPLLFLHGEDGLLFAEPFLQLLGAHFEVLAPLHPGWGGPARPAHVSTLDDIAYVYLDLLDTMPGPLPVVGVSIGAWLAAEIATKSTAAISALILAAPVGVKFGGREDRAFVDMYASDPGDVVRSLYADPAHAPGMSSLDPDQLRQLAVAQEAVIRVGWQPYLHNPKLRHRLGRINVPTLVIGGDHDGFVLESGYVDAIAELVGTQARAETIPDAGHRLEEEAPEQLAGLIAAFVTDATGSTAETKAG